MHVDGREYAAAATDDHETMSMDIPLKILKRDTMLGRINEAGFKILGSGPWGAPGSGQGQGQGTWARQKEISTGFVSMVYRVTTEIERLGFVVAKSVRVFTAT